MNTHKIISEFLASLPLSTISKVLDKLGWFLPVYYLKERPGIATMICVGIIEKNSITAEDFINLFLLEMNDLNLA
jgi:hypothetical protein